MFSNILSYFILYYLPLCTQEVLLIKLHSITILQSSQISIMAGISPVIQEILRDDDKWFDGQGIQTVFNPKYFLCANVINELCSIVVSQQTFSWTKFYSMDRTCVVQRSTQLLHLTTLGYVQNQELVVAKFNICWPFLRFNFNYSRLAQRCWSTM